MRTLHLLAYLLAAAATTSGAAVEVLRTPNGGIQPQSAVDGRGVVHLVYYQGDPAGGDLFYVTRAPGEAGFSAPLKINTRPGSAIAMGTIRGAHLALGAGGRPHVAWNGGTGAGKVNVGGKATTPLLYTRLAEGGKSFEPERNLITHAAGLDGGGSVAADGMGNVYVVWHAPVPGADGGEANRAVFIARSSDSGKTFAPEERATDEALGACGCCGLRAFADARGSAYVLYRAAEEGVFRDATLLVSRDGTSPFKVLNRDRWKATTCPMSSASLTAAGDRTLAAWETKGQISFAAVNPRTGVVSKPVRPRAGAKNDRKHPVAVAGEAGDTLLVWTEGTGWKRGGTLAWQVFDHKGNPTAESGRQEGVPTWGLATAFATAGGGFTIVY